MSVPSAERDVFVRETGGCMASPSLSDDEPWTYSVYLGADLRAAGRSLSIAKDLARALAIGMNRPAWFATVTGQCVPLVL